MYATGIDVSYHNGAVDWPVATGNACFVFVRASINKTADERFVGNAISLNSLLHPWSAYHALVPQTYPDNDAKAQAQTFVNIIEPLVDYRLPNWLDVERSDGLGMAQMQDFICQFLDEYYRLTGCVCGIYTSRSKWSELVSGYATTTSIPVVNTKKRPLFVAHYTTGVGPLMPYDWSYRFSDGCWDFWQHSASGDGAVYGCQSDHVDLVRFNGDMGQFLAYIGEEVPAPPPEPQVTTPQFGVVSGCDNLRIRTSGELLSNNIIGTVPKGTQLAVCQDRYDPAGDWVPVISWAHRDYLDLA